MNTEVGSARRVWEFLPEPHVWEKEGMKNQRIRMGCVGKNDKSNPGIKIFT